MRVTSCYCVTVSACRFAQFVRKYLSTLSRLGRPRQYRDAATIAVLMFGQAAYADLLIEIDKSTQRMTAVIHSQACEARRGIFRGGLPGIRRPLSGQG